MKRLFIGIGLPDKVKKETGLLGISLPNSRVVDQEQLHITLRFLGETEGSTNLDIREVLNQICYSKFYIRLKGTGVFPNGKIPRILYSGISPTEEITTLKRKIDNQLVTLAIPREKKKYIPHVTLARLKNSPPKQIGHWLSISSLYQSESFEITSFNLYSSLLTPKGVIHTIEESYPLTDTR